MAKVLEGYSLAKVEPRWSYYDFAEPSFNIHKEKETAWVEFGKDKVVKIRVTVEVVDGSLE